MLRSHGYMERTILDTPRQLHLPGTSLGVDQPLPLYSDIPCQNKTVRPANMN